MTETSFPCQPGPLSAWDALLAGRVEPAAPGPLDYSDAGQVAREVFIDGERWTVLLRRAS